MNRVNKIKAQPHSVRVELCLLPVLISNEARSPKPLPTQTVQPSRSSQAALIGDSLKSTEITGLLCAEVS